MSTVLSVNVNKVALLRNQRDLAYPSVTRAAEVCIAAGAGGITVHPRPDERHIRRQDVLDLSAMLTVEFNVEGNPEEDFLQLVDTVRPAQCTLVPDSPDQRTSDHGWDLKTDGTRLEGVIRRLHDCGARVALFMDAEPEAMARAAEVGADRIELYTEPYAAAFGTGQQAAVLGQFIEAAEAAGAVGLGVNAGHDLSAGNLRVFANSVPALLEVSIGHALIADALFDGLDATVKRYLRELA